MERSGSSCQSEFVLKRASSHEMTYERKDRYYKKAKEEGFKSRAAYKLLQINSKFHLLKPGMVVVDLGCAPGSWLQVLSQKIGPSGMVVGVDLEEISHFSQKNIYFIRGDIREEKTTQRILAHLGRKADLILSDIAPHLTGIKFKDQYASYELADQAFQLCHVLLRKEGALIVKIFPGDELEHLKNNLKPSFPEIKVHIPDATRKTSSEVYVVGRGFKQ